MWEYTLHTEIITTPLDPLESAAGHVDDASCRTGHRTNKTFAKTFEEACGTLLLGSCKVTRHQTHVTRMNMITKSSWTDNYSVCYNISYIVE